MSTPSAVWTVRYTAGEGYDCTLTLSGDDTRTVLQEARQVLLYDLPRWTRPANPAPAEPTATVDAPASVASNGATNGHSTPNGNGNPPRLDWCPIHNCQMQRRSSNGETWFSHRTPDGAWCRGKVAKAVAP